jgi:hypothetical protein
MIRSPANPRLLRVNELIRRVLCKRQLKDRIIHVYAKILQLSFLGKTEFCYRLMQLEATGSGALNRIRSFFYEKVA